MLSVVGAVVAGALAGALHGGPRATSVAQTVGVGQPSPLLTISNGTNRVLMGGKTVVFPTTVTDAVWSPNGARLAFVDADGNIDTARPDGSGLMVLTPTEPGVTRSHPTWIPGRAVIGEKIIYAETGTDGVSRLYMVAAGGQDVDDSGTPTEARIQMPSDDTGGDTAPVAFNDLPSICHCGNDVGYLLIYQHQGASGPQITSFEVPYDHSVIAGSAPALSPDGLRVAYVSARGQIDVAKVYQANGPLAPGQLFAPVQITFGAHAPTDPTWSPDGRTIAYRTKNDVETVPVAVPAGAKTNPPTIVSKTPGVPNYRHVTATTLARVAGADPVAQSIAVSQATWPTPTAPMRDRLSLTPFAQRVYIAPAAPTPDDFALAALDDASPLLLNPTGDLDPRVKAEITRVLGPPERTTTEGFGTPGIAQSIVILGDTSEISAAAQAQLQAMNYNITRADPAEVVAESVPPDTTAAGYAKNVYVVASDDPASITVAAAAVRSKGGALLYTDGSTLPSATRAFLDSLTPPAGEDKVQIYAIGQEAVAAAGSWTPGPSSTLTNLAAATPVATAALASPTLIGSPWPLLVGSPRSVTLVNPDSLVDTELALSGDGWPIVVDPSAGLDGDAAAWLSANATTVGTVWLDGDTGTLPDSTASAVINALAPASTRSIDNPRAAIHWLTTAR